MKILKDLLCKADDTLEEIWFYAKEATLLKESHKEIADTYIDLAKTHIEIYGKLHDKMVALIEKEKQKGVEIPKGMIDVWKYEHGELVEEFSKVKYLVEEYSKKYWHCTHKVV